MNTCKHQYGRPEWYIKDHDQGATENASPVKCNTMKMTDRIAALEFARPGK